jgi:hypothetical protein
MGMFRIVLPQKCSNPNTVAFQTSRAQEPGKASAHSKCTARLQKCELFGNYRSRRLSLSVGFRDGTFTR